MIIYDEYLALAAPSKTPPRPKCDRLDLFAGLSAPALRVSSALACWLVADDSEGGPDDADE